MKTAGVRELKARLSEYLRDVQRGEVVLVTDRGHVVAEMRPPGAGDRDATPGDLRWRRLVERGSVRPAAEREALRNLEAPDLRLPRGTAQGLIDAERSE
ncbi:MAG: type II toxin-antitoxin system Phd/YefM family antitoxin [Anaeromyxobacteraceae bacterium]